MEFTYGGEAGVTAPADPEVLGDEEWAEWLFVRTNPAGSWAERWYHAAGCRRWLVVERDTVTQVITPVGGGERTDEA